MPALTDTFEATEVICGVLDKELDNSDDVLTQSAELHEFSPTAWCTVYDPTLT